MRKTIFWAVLIGMGLLLYGCSHVVATVNGESITKKQLDRALEQAGGKQMLQNLITEKMIKEYAAAHHVQVSDQEVEKEVSKVKKTLGPLNLQTLTPNRLKNLKKSIKLNLLLQKDIMATIPKSKVRAFYEANKSSLPEAELSAIVVADPKQAQAILSDLKKGKPFATEASQFSLDPVGRENGGYLGYVSEGDLMKMSPAIAKAVFSLKSGEVSSPIKTPKGYYILKALNFKNHFVQLKSEIETLMAHDRVKTFLLKLRTEYKVVYKGSYAVK
jgi:foldase protein PrsA